MGRGMLKPHQRSPSDFGCMSSAVKSVECGFMMEEIWGCCYFCSHTHQACQELWLVKALICRKEGRERFHKAGGSVDRRLGSPDNRLKQRFTLPVSGAGMGV